ncbi:endonuclease/exonuclease/phosphatase family protein [Maricaulaceae bacterium NA33B04]|nr:endonuclease/exonuclease/phosphatase family protein [Maricaulaceae bacterium NA33B04]
MRLQAGATALIALVFGWLWLSAPFAPVTPRFDREVIRVAVFNARNSPEALSHAAGWAQDNEVDVIMLAEARGMAPDALKALFSHYPHGEISAAMTSTFGLSRSTRSAVFSRWPIKTTVFSEVMADQFSRPILSLNLSHPDGNIQVTGLHPFPPGTPGALLEQRRIFEAVAGHVPDDGRFVILGDLNTTVWSPNFSRLPGRRAGDPRFASTFPAPLAVGGITIDHVLIGDAFAVTAHEVAPHLDSDHLPVLVELRTIADGP